MILFMQTNRRLLDHFAERAEDKRTPKWLRIWYYAQTRPIESDGVVRLWRGEGAGVMECDPRNFPKIIHAAVQHGLLLEGSTSNVLLLAFQAEAPAGAGE